jgi:hypothetical protein
MLEGRVLKLTAFVLISGLRLSKEARILKPENRGQRSEVNGQRSEIGKHLTHTHTQSHTQSGTI